MLRKTTLALLLALVLLLMLGCVEPEDTATDPTDSLPSDSTGTEDVQTPPDHTDGGDLDGDDLLDGGLILPDDEQFDTGGFPNPPEDDATKRY